jgi:hypothetical protein
LAFRYDEPKQLYDVDYRIDADQYLRGGSLFKKKWGEPGNDGSISYEVTEHGNELCKFVYKIATDRPDVHEVTIRVSCTFRELTVKDRYGKEHTSPEKTFHCGDIAVTDLDEVRKYTEEAYIREKQPWFNSQLVDLLTDTRTSEN